MRDRRRVNKMDKPLLFGESSNGGRTRDRVYRRSEAITYGSSYQKAAALVDLVTFFNLFFPSIMILNCYSLLIAVWRILLT